MFKASQVFKAGCALILLVGGMTSQLTAQNPNVINYTIADNGGRAAVSYVAPSSPVIASASQGCRIYGSCASSGCQNGNESQSSPACSDIASCGCGKCGLRHKLHCKPCWKKDLEYFQHPPAPSCPGDRLYQIIGAQQANGRLAQLVFYNFHFNFDAGLQRWALSPAGSNNVKKIARIWPSTPGSVVVEPTGNAAADQVRLIVVQQSLAQSGIQGDVVLGSPPSLGISGVEAINIYQQRLQNSPLSGFSSQSGGTSVQSGAGSGN